MKILLMSGLLIKAQSQMHTGHRKSGPNYIPCNTYAMEYPIFLVAHIQFLITFLFVSFIQGIMNQLSDVMYRFNFSLPPQYALVIRALGSLEGTATVLDPQFKVVASAYPFIIGRLLADPDPQMRKILRELLIRNNGSIRWNRLERLV